MYISTVISGVVLWLSKKFVYEYPYIFSNINQLHKMECEEYGVKEKYVRCGREWGDNFVT